jgi:hypothetical protein
VAFCLRHTWVAAGNALVHIADSVRARMRALVLAELLRPWRHLGVMFTPLPPSRGAAVGVTRGDLLGG